MGNWFTGVNTGFTSWFGSGLSSFLTWLFGGLATVLTKVINAARGFWDVLDSIWNFAVGFLETVFGLLSTFFPFVPEPVMSVIYLGLLAVLIIGIVKKVGAK